jgi:hypothetical protein
MLREQPLVRAGKIVARVGGAARNKLLQRELARAHDSGTRVAAERVAWRARLSSRACESNRPIRDVATHRAWRALALGATRTAPHSHPRQRYATRPNELEPPCSVPRCSLRSDIAKGPARARQVGTLQLSSATDDDPIDDVADAHSPRGRLPLVCFRPCLAGDGDDNGLVLGVGTPVGVIGVDVQTSLSEHAAIAVAEAGTLAVACRSRRRTTTARRATGSWLRELIDDACLE